MPSAQRQVSKKAQKRKKQMRFKFLYILCLLYFSFLCFGATDSILIHAIHKETYSCTEHWQGQFRTLGDALGTDCVINGYYQDEERLFARPFKNKGLENEDWYGFDKEVLAPCDCEVIKIHINNSTNQPGIMKPGRASMITFKDSSGNFVLLAHVRDVLVKEGEVAVRGSVVAKVGNNGYSRNPHIHIGAWDKDNNPLQIRFDQRTLALQDRNVN